MRHFRPLASLLGLVLLAGCATRPPEVLIQKWSGTLQADERIRVVNHFGDVRVRPASAGFVGVTAAAQCRAGSEVIVPTFVADGVHIDTDGTRCARVDIAVHVAPGHRLTLESDAGNIRTRGIDNPVAARSTVGSIRLQSSGTMNAETGAGAIVLRPLRPKWLGRHSARSDSGLIRALAPRDHVAVTACSARVSIEASLGEGRRRAGCVRLQRGSGASAYDLASERGAIEIMDSTRPLKRVTGGASP